MGSRSGRRLPIHWSVSSVPSILWDQAQATEHGRGIQVPVAGATPEWCAQFKHSVEVRRHEARQDPWGQIGLIADVIFVPMIPVGSEALLRETLDELVARAHRRVAAGPAPQSPEQMLRLMRSLAG